MFMKGKARYTTGEISALTEKTPAEVEHERRENVVIIPTYNEADNLKLLVLRILQKGAFDVLIVDDNSPDGTGEMAEELAARFPGRVDVLHRPGKLGLGTAYIAGFHYALQVGYQRVFTMDADFSHDPNSLPALRTALDDADVVLGSRYVPGGGTVRWSLWRRLLSRGGSAYARLMLGLSIRDLTGGFKGFRRQVLEILLPEMDAMRSNGYAFQIETTYLCSRHTFRIVEVPIVFENRVVGKSKMNRRIIMEALRVVLALRLGKGSSRTHKDVPPGNPLPSGRVMAIVMAVVGLIIILGAFGIVPRWITRAEQGVSVQPATRSHRFIVAPAQSRMRRLASETPTKPQASPATIQLNGENLTSNVPLSFAGSGFGAGEELAVTVANSQGQLVAKLPPPVMADHTGHVSVISQNILSNLAPGLMFLQVVGERSHRWARVSFALQRIPPNVELDTYAIKSKSDVGFAGVGFMPNEVVYVYVGRPGGQIWGTASTNAEGDVEGRLRVPLITEGNYILYFVGQRSQTPASISLNVQGFHPWVTLDTYAPSVHTRLGFSGQDFVPGEEVLVYLNSQGSQDMRPDTHEPGELVVRIRADSLGRIVAPAAWEVPDIKGDNTLTFVGEESEVAVTTSFIVMR